MTTDVTQSLDISWPPPYKLRISKRAKNMYLNITPERGVEIISPRRISQTDILSVLTDNRRWVEQQLAKFAPLAESLAGAERFPSELDLPAIEQHWKVDYQSSSGKLRLHVRPHQQLVVMGDISNPKSCQRLLRDWLKIMADKWLLPSVTMISEQTGLDYKKVSFRHKKTQWGSCSEHHVISFNVALLFLPKRLAEHIIIHELCHTVHLDHSPAFWRLVTRHDPHCRDHRALARDADQYLPGWYRLC